MPTGPRAEGCPLFAGRARGGALAAARSSWREWYGNPALAAAVFSHEARGDVLLDAWIEHDEHLVAGLDHGVRLGHEARSAAKHRNHERAVRKADIGDRLARRGSVIGDDQF